MQLNRFFNLLLTLLLFVMNSSCEMKFRFENLNSLTSASTSFEKVSKVYVDITDATLVEGGFAIINVAVNPIRNVDTVVNLKLTPTNSSYVRFNPIPAQITIPAGMSSKGVLLNTIDDSFVQGQEFWQFVISPVDSSLQANPGILVITLNDNDGGSFPAAPSLPNSGQVPTPRLLKEINSMPAGLSSISFGSKVIFEGVDAAHGKELWISDGTVMGTSLLMDINPGIESSFPKSFFRDEAGQFVYFTAKTANEGIELWRTDGTQTGTILLQDINSGVGTSNPDVRFTKGGLVFFIASNSIYGREIYVSDGSVTGTRLLKDLSNEAESLYSTPEFVAFQGQIYFSASINQINPTKQVSEIWKTDGTPAGTIIALNSTSDGQNFSYYGFSNLQVIGSKLYFSARTASYGDEVYTSDGTSSGTSVLLDIASGPGSSYASTRPYNVDGNFYMTLATDPDPNAGFWLTDGTQAGTQKIHAAANVYEMMGTINNKFIFNGIGTGSEFELWTSDGTSLGTSLLKDLNPGSTGSTPNSSFPKFVAKIGNRIFFTATTASEGFELWSTDGTSAGTQLLKDINPGAGSSYPSEFLVVGTNLVFSATSPNYGNELWISDGSPAETRLLKDINPGPKSSGPVSFNGLDSTRIFFAAYNFSSLGPTIFVSDLSDAGTIGINHALVESKGTNTKNKFVELNGHVYFDGMDDKAGNPLWISDGTEAGTSLVKDVNPNITCSDIAYLSNVQGSLFFTATAENTGNEIYISDGTTAGTQLLKDIYPGTTSGATSLFLPVATDLHRTYFAAKDDNGTELWVTDGTSSGTRMVIDIFPGAATAGSGVTTPNSSLPDTFFPIPGTGAILFSATDGTSARRGLYWTDGSANNAVEIQGLGAYQAVYIVANSPGPLLIGRNSSYQLTGLLNFDQTTKTVSLIAPLGAGEFISTYFYSPRLNTLFFGIRNNPFSSLSLWKSDGTTAGTSKVKEIPILNFSSSLVSFSDNGTSILFNYTNTAATSSQLWKTDGTSAGTDLIATLNTSSISILASLSGLSFFNMNDATNGLELWVTDGTSAGTRILKDINPGSASSSPANLTVLDGKVYFTANDGVHGTELWSTDGTANGTTMVDDINPGSQASSPALLTPIGHTLFFKATKILSGEEVWTLSTQ